jgi:hypothetical protein
MEWLWQNLLSSAVWEVLLVIGGAAALGYVKRKVPEHAATIAYAAFGATCVAILIFTFTGHGLLSKRRPAITSDNIELNVRQWADDLGLGVTRMQPLPNQEMQFGLVVTPADGNPIMVFRGVKEKPGFLQMQCALTLSPEHLAMLSKLSKQQADDAIRDIKFEMDRSRIGYVMQTASGITSGQATTTMPSIVEQTIIVTKPLAITDDLSEAAFGERINELDSEVGIVKGATDSTLKRYSQQIVTPHVVQQ